MAEEQSISQENTNTVEKQLMQLDRTEYEPSSADGASTSTLIKDDEIRQFTSIKFRAKQYHLKERRIGLFTQRDIVRGRTINLAPKVPICKMKELKNRNLRIIYIGNRTIQSDTIQSQPNTMPSPVTEHQMAIMSLQMEEIRHFFEVANIQYILEMRMNSGLMTNNPGSESINPEPVRIYLVPRPATPVQSSSSYVESDDVFKVPYPKNSESLMSKRNSSPSTSKYISDNQGRIHRRKAKTPRKFVRTPNIYKNTREKKNESSDVVKSPENVSRLCEDSFTIGTTEVDQPSPSTSAAPNQVECTLTVTLDKEEIPIDQEKSDRSSDEDIPK